MCGIFGYIGSISREKALTCTNSLAHRGPDATGLWHSESACLGHRRLSILDLSESGNQPMQYGNGRYWITYNGEIYNFIELRDELKKKGHSFRTETDTEVVLASFVQWGEECQSRFNGMWAFGIWDTMEKTLFLSRDRFGIKPFFYTWLRDNHFAFSSEMKALYLLLESIRPNLPLIRGLTDYGPMISYEATSECLIEGIHRFPAGHSAILKNGTLKISRWWNTLDHLMDDVPKRYLDQVDMFRELFFDATRLRMRSDVSTATALSGGLDSSSVASAVYYASRKRSERVREVRCAFTASFPGTEHDETEYAEMVAKHNRLDLVTIKVDTSSLVDKLYDYLYLFEEIFLVFPVPHMRLYEAIRSHSIKVTLDGHGGDELFAGYPSDISRSLYDCGINILSAYGAAKAISGCRASYYDRAKPSIGGQMRRWLRINIDRMKGKVNSDPITSQDQDHPQWKTLGHLNKKLYINTHEQMLPTLLRNYDRYSMASGVEIRMPFMDYRIVRFAFSIPWISKVRNGFSKAIVRDAMAGYMPYEVAYRKSKIGFGSPIVHWFKGPLKEFLMDTINSESFKTSNLIDVPYVSEVITDVIETEDVPFNKGEVAWGLLSCYLWEQALMKGYDLLRSSESTFEDLTWESRLQK